MINTPEDILQNFMQLTGMSREEAENYLADFENEIPNGRVYKLHTSKKKKEKYDAENYPHYLPSDYIRKYTIRVSLRDSTPTIWRRFDCPSNISLRHFTELLLRLMGWEDVHLNRITKGYDISYVPSYQYSSDDDFDDFTYIQEDYRLSDILDRQNKTLRWEYDFGDSWEHEIRLSSVHEYKDGESHSVVFKAGKCACPPEDCGGVWGYQNLLEALEKRKSHKRLTSEEKELLEWTCWDNDYDPEELDVSSCIEICNYFSDEEDCTNVQSTPDDSPKSSTSLSPLYDDVLTIAFRIRELEPWEKLNDSDVYAIRMQDGSEIYVATMGNAGSSPEIQLYDGPDSFQHYLNLARREHRPDFEIMENISWSKYKAIMYQEPIDKVMEPKQYKLIQQWAKEHNIAIYYDNGYPFPQLIRPHRSDTMKFPDDELSRFKEALEAIAWLSQKIIDTEDCTTLGFKGSCVYPKDEGGKVVPLIVKDTEGYKIESSKLPGRIDNYESVELPDSELQPLSSIKKKGGQYCRLVHIPGCIRPAGQSDEAYKPLVFLCIDKQTEKTSSSEPCELTDTFEKDALRQYIKKVQKEGLLPQRIITDDLRTEAILKHFCQHLGIILEVKSTRIPQLTRFCQQYCGM